MGRMRRFLFLLALCVTAYAACSASVLADRRLTRQPIAALSSCYQFIFDRSMARGKPFPVLLSDMPEMINRREQWVPGYGPQAAAMPTFPPAAHLIQYGLGRSRILTLVESKIGA